MRTGDKIQPGILWGSPMVNEVFLLSLVICYAILFSWAFRTLPQEDWQFLASLPKRKTNLGTWSGLNLTYYGFLTAMAVTIAVALAIVLMGSLSLPLISITVLVVALLALTVPAAKLIAQAIEDKMNTFTIGGASFVGLIAAPWVITLINSTLAPRMGFELPMFGTLALLAVAYALGEGTGRLACISFGCCYGKPVSVVPAWWGYFFRFRYFAFIGQTKKVAYEGGLESVPVIPVQAITAVLYVGSGLLGLALFLGGQALAAFMITVLITQAWRALSELLRADYRGRSGLSAYQTMAVIGCFYALILIVLLPNEPRRLPDIVRGLTLLWHPAVILFLQALWLMIFLYTGRSRVTASTISFSILKDRI